MMKTCKLNKRYCRISTLDELQSERDKLHYRIGLKEIDLRNHTEDIKESLTLSNICRMAISRMELSSVAMGLTQGFGLFSSLFRKKRRKHTCSF